MSDDLTIAEWIKPYLPIIGGLLRGLIQIASGLGFSWALAVSGDQVTMATTATAMLITLLWSMWQKIAAVRAARKSVVAAAVASAEKGTPVSITVTPNGQANIATRVSAVEAAAAPSVPGGAPQPAPAP